MRRGRIVIGIITGSLGLLLSASALAASPGEIAEDLKDGRLDGIYSQADLQAYLASAVAQGYGNPVVTPTAAGPTSGVAGVSTPATGAKAAAPVTGVAGVRTPPAQQPLAATRQVGTLPFTGLDLALLTIGGTLLLLLGLGARRAGRRA